MKKFKVGDVVRIKKDLSGCEDVVPSMFKYQGRKVVISGVISWHGRHNYHVEGNIWTWHEEMLEPLNETIVIFRRGSEVIALDKSTGKRASAKCNPKDEFSFKVGAELAFGRLMSKEDTDVNDISVGDIVEVVDDGKTYSAMQHWFDNMNEHELKGHFVVGGTPREGVKYKVKAIHPHEWLYEGDVYAIQDPNTTQVFLIGKKGIKKVM